MQIIKYKSAQSTNSLLMELSKKSAKSWTVIWTSDQTSGRGYAGNEWKSEKDKNLAVSVLIINDLSYNDLIYFNQWVSNAVANVLSKFSNKVNVKWPNDIIIDDKKVSGILIETHKLENKLHIITGIGLNVNQISFENYPNAGSMATQIGGEFDLNEILSDLLTEMEESYEMIQNKSWERISEVYHSKLYRIGEWSLFENSVERFKGKIKGVNHLGQLEVMLEDESVQVFNHKEIQLIYE